MLCTRDNLAVFADAASASGIKSIFHVALCPAFSSLRIVGFCDLERPYLEQKLGKQFDVITFNSNCNRSMEQLHRQDQALISTLTQKYSFDPVKRSSANAHAPPGTDERMWKTRNVLSYRCPETLDLLIRNWSSLPFTSDETQHAWCSQ